MASGPTRYRRAYNAGASGQNLPEGLASMADKDPRIDQAHDAGRSGTSFDDWYSSNVAPPAPSATPPAPAPAARGRRAPSPSPRSPRSPYKLPTPSSPTIIKPGKSTGPVQSAAGFFLGMVMAALALSVVEYGPGGPLLWFKAKFLNEAAGAAAASSGGVATSNGSVATQPGAGSASGNATQPVYITPTGNGRTGVDLNGNTYTKGANGQWQLKTPAGFSTPVGSA